MRKITVIMPVLMLNEEARALTAAAIDSLGDVELIIVDDCSPMGGGFLRRHATTYVRNSSRLGFAKSVNKGLKLAGDDLIAIANNDIRVSKNWQNVVREAFTYNENLFSVHLRMTDYDTPFVFGSGTWLTGKERWCQGSFFVIDGRRKQLYDEGLLNSYDDWDYFMRARKNGYLTAYTNRACFQHNHSFTQRLNPNRAKENAENAKYFMEKWGDTAENIFAKQYPEQMKEAWRLGFDEGL